MDEAGSSHISENLFSFCNRAVKFLDSDSTETRLANFWSWSRYISKPVFWLVSYSRNSSNDESDDKEEILVTFPGGGVSGGGPRKSENLSARTLVCSSSREPSLAGLSMMFWTLVRNVPWSNSVESGVLLEREDSDVICCSVSSDSGFRAGFCAGPLKSQTAILAGIWGIGFSSWEQTFRLRAFFSAKGLTASQILYSCSFSSSSPRLVLFLVGTPLAILGTLSSFEFLELSETFRDLTPLAIVGKALTLGRFENVTVVWLLLLGGSNVGSFTCAKEGTPTTNGNGSNCGQDKAKETSWFTTRVTPPENSEELSLGHSLRTALTSVGSEAQSSSITKSFS